MTPVGDTSADGRSAGETAAGRLPDGGEPAGRDEPRYGERLPVRQAPKYGEYAPPGWVSPVPPVDEPVASPGRESADFARDPFSVYPPRSYDAPPPTGAPVPGPPPLPVRRSSGRFFTMFLLVFGGWHVVTGLFSTSTFAASLVAEFKQYGYLSGTFQSLGALQSVSAWCAVLSVVFFVVIVFLTLRRMRVGRSAWWLPVVGGLVANIGMGIAVVIVIMHDPSYVGVTAG